MTYHRFTTDTKLSDMIHANHQLLRVLSRFDVHPGFGDGTVADICRERGIAPEFFCEIVNVYNDTLYFPETRLRRLDVQSIVDYLKKAHQDYMGAMLPAIGREVQALVASGDGRNTGIGMIGSMYAEYQDEFIHHIHQEEELVFPHALLVMEAYRKGQSLGSGIAGDIHTIKEFTREHSHMEEKLFDLQSLLVKYIEPPFDVTLCRSVICGLHDLEQDVQDHARIEDRILFTLIQQMEAEIEKRR